MDLGTVEGLTELRDLQVSNASALVVGETLPALTRLAFHDVSIDDLPGCDSLETLSLDSSTARALDVSRYPSLKALAIHGSPCPKLSGLAASKVRTLSLRSPNVELDGPGRRGRAGRGVNQ